MKEGDILGHEFMGVVEQTGSEVTRVRPGDRVVVPVVIACGACLFGERPLFAACETTNDGRVMPELLEPIGNGRLQPDVIVSHDMTLGDAARGCEMFDKKQDDCRKVILTP